MALRQLRPSLGSLNTSRAKPAPKQAAPFYKTKDWREARALSIGLHGNRCAECGRKGCRLFVDHIVELKDGGAALDQSNLRPLCGACHTAKTAGARAARLGTAEGRGRPGCGPDATPGARGEGAGRKSGTSGG